MSEIFGVVGSGTMGAGIAQAAARAGFDVVMRDVAQEFLARGMTAIDKSLQRDVDKERLSADEKSAIMTRIRTTTDIGAQSRSEEHTSELQSHLNLVCRLLLEKKKRRTMRSRS